MYYRGRDMTLVHKGMRISEGDWNVFLGHACERRSNNPSLKRPVFRLRRSKNPAADGPLPRIGEGRGDEERGAIWTGALCGAD
jgi:hypothetical protein